MSKAQQEAGFVEYMAFTDAIKKSVIFTCCHPALPPDAQIALTLREVCGLTTEEISARADLCRRLGRTADARASYQRALELARQEPERRFLERRLRELGG